MTTRTRQAPGSAPIAVANGMDVGADRFPAFSWEDWFLHASPQQRAEALGLAQKQGLLYAQQLPALKNGVKPVSPAGLDTPLSQVIPRVLAGKADALPRLVPEELAFFDADLDDLQRQAVLRALTAPDLVMIQGLPGTGKSRVVAEIILQAARRGWRTLFLAGQPASIDVILQRFVNRSEIFALRFLDSLEKPDSLPSWLRGFTIDEQKRSFLEQLLGGARDRQAVAESACKRRRDDESLWADLQALTQRHQDLDARRTALQAELPRIAQSVEHDADAVGLDTPFGARMAEWRQRHDLAMREIDAALKADQDVLGGCDKDSSAVETRLSDLEPAYLAKKHGRFWTLSYWIHFFDSTLISETEALYAQQKDLQTRRQEISGRIDRTRQQQNECTQRFNLERAELVSAEIEARQQGLARKQEELDAEGRQLDAEWAAQSARLGVQLDARTSEAITSARQAWEEQKRHDERQCQFAQQWTKFVEQTGSTMAGRLPAYANLLAGTLMRWHTDAKFRDAVAQPVDLLIVEDAEALTEADLQKLSRHAGRCVLVGQATMEPTPAPTAAEKASRALLPAPLVSAACWNKLWQTLGGDAGLWPSSWRREQGRLTCQLVPLGPDDQQYLETEGLADAPDIALRILHRPRSRPCLAQVLFGPHCSFADAFRFMMREVQEFPLAPVGRSAWWTEDAERVRRHLSPIAERIHAWLDIEPGLRLGAVADSNGDASRIALIEFDKSASWDRDKAEGWLGQHRAVVDHERTVFLQTPYRFPSRLAQAVQTLVRCEDWLAPRRSESPGAANAVEFIPVPSNGGHDWPRDGAGLELDLTATRYGDRLPAGLRQGLPGRGFVNYLEAQAVVRRLETWSLQEAQPASRVAVLALHEGQVALLRQLVEQSPGLRGRHFSLEIGLPSRLHQRECNVVFLSLTRSHSHRAVAFSEDVADLPLALTRATGRLLVFGDPGALLKRIHWHGPIDHLDAASAHQELTVLARLAALLQSTSAAPSFNGQANGRA